MDIIWRFPLKLTRGDVISGVILLKLFSCFILLFIRVELGRIKVTEATYYFMVYLPYFWNSFFVQLFLFRNHLNDFINTPFGIRKSLGLLSGRWKIHLIWSPLKILSKFPILWFLSSWQVGISFIITIALFGWGIVKVRHLFCEL